MLIPGIQTTVATLAKPAPAFIVVLLISGSITAQDAPPAAPAQPAYQVLSESTVRQKDGSTVTFRQVVPPVVTVQAQPAAAAPAAPLAAAPQAAQSQVSALETQMLSISASVHASGFTVLRWGPAAPPSVSMP